MSKTRWLVLKKAKDGKHETIFACQDKASAERRRDEEAQKDSINEFIVESETHYPVGPFRSFPEITFETKIKGRR
jgi:hypothetical protein